MGNRYSAYRRGTDAVSPDTVDRILVWVCALIWMLLLGVSVAAAVALVDLGRGFHRASAGPPQTPWLLYAVIAVSALIIVAAIPVLLRARRMAPADHSVTAPASVVEWLMPRPGATATTTDGPAPSVDRVWLRGIVLLVGAIGVALTCVAAATYLMALGNAGLSWLCYGLAGLVTMAMPAIEWLHVRQLRALADWS